MKRNKYHRLPDSVLVIYILYNKQIFLLFYFFIFYFINRESEIERKREREKKKKELELQTFKNNSAFKIL